ncbi:MAG: septum site-determining protein MinC [Proteobacteria bacterium]|nr:septum site-determining protein MinC [Pseudomonadota bacterium]
MTVKLRGTRHGFALTLDPTVSYEVIEKEAGDLFLNLRQLAKGANVSLDTGLADIPPDLFMKLGEFLKNRFGVQDVFNKIKAENKPAPEPHLDIQEAPGGCDMGEMKMMAGRVRSGQRVSAENHLVILGDVNPGGEVFAGGDILVLGSLLGTAIAGQSDRESAIILALDFRPTQVQIAGVVAAGMASSTGKKIEFAYVENGAIVVDNYVTANPFGKLPMLEER